MRVGDLTAADEGKRLRVTAVKVGDAERSGFVNDTERLLGQEGLLVEANMFEARCIQAHVQWDAKDPGSLSLACEDEVELL